MSGSKDSRRRGQLSRRGFLGYAGAGAGAGAIAAAGPASAAPPGPLTASGFGRTVAAENALAGSPMSEWESWEDDEAIAGFTTEYSFLPGQTVTFKIRTDATAYRIRVYRLGWYQGHGARRLADVTPSVSLPQSQPDPLVDEATGLIDCGNWAVSATWRVPDDALSGVYYALFDRTDGGRSSHTVFVVRRSGPSDILVQTSEMTMHAYNRYGGNSLYYGEPVGRAYKVSYNRPFNNGEAESNFFNAEIALLRWLERNGYDVAYCGGIDVHRDASVLQDRKVFVSSGHDEYVTGPQRDHVTEARDRGVHLIFMTGNEYFWRVRMEPSVDGTTTPDRTLVCYKETLANAKIDPLPEWTGTWRDPRFSPPSNGGRPENELTGTLFRAILPVSAPDLRIRVAAEYARHRTWRDTAIADLAPGEVYELSPNTLGYEFDVDADNGHRPPGLIRLSTTEAEVPQLLVDHGSTYVRGTCTHHTTMYRAASGALVWGLGTVQWSYGLDEYHICDPGTPTDAATQQATLNVLADMGVQPVTRQTGLVPASASTDTLAPTVTITSPAPEAKAPIGAPVVVSGTATDSGGGIVAAVEVSLDGGVSWHLATGLESWSYVFTPMETGTIEVHVRAIDDSCNIGAAALVLLEGVSRGFPCSIWPEGTIPQTESVDETTPIEVGVRFRSEIDGFLTGLRFYKGPGNTGTHVGRLWTQDGRELASATFADETASGWQTLTMPAVAVSAGVTYVASVFMPEGRYSADAGYFAAAYELAPLTAPASDAQGGNGVYRYGGPGFPTSSFGASNYWVDVVFDTDNRVVPAVVDQAPAAGLQSVAPGTVVTATFNEQVDPDTVEMSLVGPDGSSTAGTVSYDPPSRTATFSPSSALGPLTDYTVTVSGARDTTGNVMDPHTWVFTTIGPPGTSPTSLWDTSAVPAVTDGDPSPVELGMKFRVSVAGSVTALRFCKAEGSNGLHVGHLWSAAGELLATAAYTYETGSGWQQVRLETPVELTPGTTYVVSYHAPHGTYGVDPGMFRTSEVARGPVRAPSGEAVGGNGVFAFGDPRFPTGSWGDANYWADIVFQTAPDVGPPEVVNVEPAPNLVSVALSAPVVASFSEPVAPDSLSLRLEGPAGPVPASLTYDAATSTATLAPDGDLSPGTEYMATVSAGDGSGNAMTEPYTWGFRTVTRDGASPVTLWDTSAVPAVAAENDASAVEVGVRVRTDRAGQLTGLRFYKGPGNEGPHVGRLWSATGSLLATTAFTGETRTGWQQALFPEPVPVEPGTTYVASYHAPSGRYAATGGGLRSARSNGPLTAPATSDQSGNGVFSYGPGGFPAQSWGGANYWVDVIFSDVSGPSVVDRAPSPGATVGVQEVVRATFDEAVVPGSIIMTLRDGTGSLVPASVSYDGAERVAVLTPSAPLAAGATYTATVEAATDLDRNPLVSVSSWSFSVLGANYVSLWSTSTVPTSTTIDDPGPVNLGTKFRASVGGSVVGVRFYKGGPDNAGPHTGVLWADDGTLLASVAFAGETARGWQTAMLATPVAITPGTVYVVSYLAPNGRYSADGGFFGSGHSSGPLEALANGASGGNGVYAYSGQVTFPVSSYNAANYWVDVLFAPGS
ncbi:DUF4082 domain-containing protein [Ornithinimicrobium pekingense]|uniref:DUF4082 domain-containing protein n=1 Tax=Ornithinimicrobium pekingense TaxID=384677 RepID=A0ABQ2F828_9MICO|nr:DUF4082 domain-containing protein [Ornithinimicrobium pekingense]GGK71216.1 hypothetical protein GCM10011509_19590 [Ornithinimicrobium pekingense]